MRVTPAQARKAAYFFLTLICGALAVILIYTAYEKFGPTKIAVDNVPFGLAAGTKVAEGDLPDEDAGWNSVPAETQQELRRAADLALNGFQQKSLEVYEALAYQYPDVFRIQWGTVNVLLETDSLNPAQRSHLDQIVRSLKHRYPESGVATYLDARVAERSGSGASALELARLASGEAPALMESRLFYAQLLYGAKHYAQATEEVRAAVSLSHGDLAEPYSLLAKLYHDQGALDSCELVVEYAISKFPADEPLLLLEGYLMEYKGRFDDAERLYRRILALHPESAEANDAIATLGQKSPPGGGSSQTLLKPKDRAQVACEILEPLVAQYPDNLPLREALGRAYLKGREFDRAKTQFLEIQSQDPDYPDIRLRIQESEATVTAPVNDERLVQSLNRAADSIRTQPNADHDFESLLGHYLVRYGASPKEFFSKYAISNFKQIAPTVWQESFFKAPYFHQYTVLFDAKMRFYGVHVVVRDSNVAARALGRTPEIYTNLVELNTSLSGVGNRTGETECGATVIDGVTWETRDNFELLARDLKKPAEVRLIRLDKSVIPDGTRLCDYLSYLRKY